MYTIFGHTGFVGSNLKEKMKGEKIFLPPKNKYIFKKPLGHIIYCIGSDNWKNDPINSYNANLGYIPIIIKNNKFLSFTFISSCRIYNNAKSTDENTDLKFNPTKNYEYYNLKKTMAENFLYCCKIKFKIIRISNIIGFSPKSPLVFPMFIKNALKKKKIVISINKNSSKDFIHIDDVVSMVIKIIKKGKSQIYNLANGKNIKLILLANQIKKHIDCKIILKNQKLKIIEPKININKIKKEFRFKPKKIHSSLKKIIDEYKKNLKTIYIK